MTSDALARSPLNVEISAKIPTGLEYVDYSRCSHWHSRARTRCRWLEWNTNFLAGCWCSTRSSLNFEDCGAVPRYRPEISWSVPTYQLDWVVVGYAVAARWHLWGYVQWAASGGHHPSCQSASTRSFHTELWVLWNRNRCCVILAASHRHPPDPPVVRAEAAPIPLGRLRSLLS
jgi:hypothetical protein